MKGFNALLRNLLLALIFVVPFIPFIVSGSMFFPFITGKNFTFRIITEILFGGWLILLFNHPEYRPRLTKLTLAALILLVVITLATVLGANPYRSFWSNFERMEGLVTQIHLVAYFLVATSILSTAKLWRRFFQTSLLASVGIVLYALEQISGTLVINQGGVRVDATLGNATYLAVYALFHIFFAVYFVITSREHWQRWAYGFIGLANTFVLYKTATRGTILGLIGGAFLFGLIMAWRGRGRVRQWAFGIISLVVVVVGLFFGLRDTDFVRQNPVLTRFASIGLHETTTESRFLIWNMSWQGFKEHPILGWGPENYVLVFDKYYNPQMWRQEPWFDRSHNVFFDWLINAGLLGLFFYLSLFALTLWYVWRSKEELIVKALITALLAGYFFHNIFVFDNLISYVLFYSVLAWINALYADGNVVELESKHAGHQDGGDSLQYIFAFVVILSMAGVMYFVSIKPINAAQKLIEGIIPNQSSQSSLDNFKEVFAMNTFGSNEAREQLLNAAATAIGKPEAEVPTAVKQAWFDFAISQMTEAIASGRQDDARSNLVFSGFLARFGALDKKYYTEALAYLDRAHKFSPNKQMIIMQQSMIYAARNDPGDKEKALELAGQAVALDADYPAAKENYLNIEKFAKDLPVK